MGDVPTPSRGLLTRDSWRPAVAARGRELHPAVEQDHDRRHGVDPLRRAYRQSAQRQHNVSGRGAASREDRQRGASATVGLTQQRPGATKQNCKGDQLSVTHQRSPRQGVTRTVIQLVRFFFAGAASAPAAGAGGELTAAHLLMRTWRQCAPAQMAWSGGYRWRGRSRR
jgi:hypothetical protein